MACRGYQLSTSLIPRESPSPPQNSLILLGGLAPSSPLQVSLLSGTAASIACPGDASLRLPFFWCVVCVCVCVSLMLDGCLPSADTRVEDHYAL